MLPKDVRLKKARDFAAMATKGRSIFGLFSTLRVRSIAPSKISTDKAKATEVQDLKVGFIISTKIFKKAVDRNRAKRRFREAVRALLPTVPKGYHLLFILKPQTLDGEYEKIKADVAHMLEKISGAMLQPIKISPRAQREMKKGKIGVGARFVKPRKTT